MSVGLAHAKAFKRNHPGKSKRAVARDRQVPATQQAVKSCQTLNTAIIPLTHSHGTATRRASQTACTPFRDAVPTADWNSNTSTMRPASESLTQTTTSSEVTNSTIIRNALRAHWLNDQCRLHIPSHLRVGATSRRLSSTESTTVIGSNRAGDGGTVVCTVR